MAVPGLRSPSASSSPSSAGGLPVPVAPIETGVAAPRLVAGAIAATWLAYMMKVPALAARAPLGATQVTTGISAARMRWTITRIEASSPPGVSRRRITSGSSASSAASIPRTT